MTVFYQIPEPNPSARPGWTRSLFNSLGDFKKVAADAIVAVRRGNLPPDKLRWHANDIVAVLVYAWLRGVSPQRATKKLNTLAIKEGIFIPKTFADGRHSRAYPHQTQVNDWLAALTPKTAKDLAKAVFGAALKLAKKRKLLPRTVVLEFDMTLCGYWGRRRDIFIKGTTQVKGAKYARQYHAALIHGWGMSLYVALDHVAKGRSKEDFLLDTARWLKSLGFKVKWALVDREYYTCGVLAGLKGLGIDVIVPAKDYAQLETAKENYLLGRKCRVQSFQVATGGNNGAKAQYARCWVMLYSEGSHPLDVLRWAIRQEITTVRSAAKEIFGLITTAPPQGHGRSFPDHILELYRMRWQIETAFREAKVKHCPWRSNIDTTQFVDKLGRMLLQDFWQLARKADPRGDALTLDTFRDEVVDVITCRMNL